MKYSISIVHRANIHISKAIEWCAEQEERLEISFIKSLDKSILYIQKHPLKCQVRYKNVRIKFMNHPKFGIHYIIDKNQIFVIGIFHTNQDTLNW